jgi:hypothetical protein
VEGLLQRVLPKAEVKMDAGHILFSRLGKQLDQQHVLHGKPAAFIWWCDRIHSMV